MFENILQKEVLIEKISEYCSERHWPVEYVVEEIKRGNVELIDKFVEPYIIAHEILSDYAEEYIDIIYSYGYDMTAYNNTTHDDWVRTFNFLDDSIELIDDDTFDEYLESGEYVIDEIYECCGEHLVMLVD